MWDATVTPSLELAYSHTFQSTHPNVGCDVQKMVLKLQSMTFQSTHPNVGCDTMPSALNPLFLYFNPRIPMWDATVSATDAEIKR